MTFPSHMRAMLLSVGVASLLMTSGCTCSPANPGTVIVRVKNGSGSPIFVNDSKGQLGATVQRNVNGNWFGFDDTPCECRTCERACDAVCDCGDAGTNLIRKLEVGQAVERTWNGVVQVSNVQCGTPCLSPENAPLDETFSVQLCYVNAVPGFSAGDGGVGVGEYPNVGVSCVDQPFLPRDGVVEVGPTRGAACAKTSECKGAELCLAGSCTTGCPPNKAPESPGLRIASPSDMGFFTQMPSGANTVFVGTGTVTSSQYNGTTLNLGLSRKGVGNQMLTGSVQVTMPAAAGPSFTVGSTVAVTVVDASAEGNPSNRAVVVRDMAGTLLFAADVGQLGRVLTPSDTAPFTLSDGAAATGCRADNCGKALFFATHFAAGSTEVDVEPGDDATINTTSGTYHVVNVWNGDYGTTRCSFSSLRPYAIWRNAN